MGDFLDSLSVTDWAAWWGAVVATAVLLWDVFKWARSGPRIRVRAVPNMQALPAVPPWGRTKLISVTAVNNGDRPTTVTHFCGRLYRNRWHFLLGIRGQEFIVTTGGIDFLGSPLPHVLEPGREWSGYAQQSKVRETAEGFAYAQVGIIHNARRRPVLVRVALEKLRPDEGEEAGSAEGAQ